MANKGDINESDGGAQGDGTWRRGRRAFLGVAAAAAGAAMLPGGSVSALAPADFAFAIDASADVNVLVGAGRWFDVTVVDLDGNELEKFERVTFTSIHRVESSHFTVRSIAPPTSVDVAA